MPIYEYCCAACGKRFELIESSATHQGRGAVACLVCGDSNTERMWSRVAVGTARKGYHRAEPLDV